MADLMTIRVIAEVLVSTHAEAGYVRRELRELITATLQAEKDRKDFTTGVIDQTIAFRVRTVQIDQTGDVVIKPLS
jgi:hypothetical protein